MDVVVGGVPSVRITTSIEHKFVENTLIRIDGVEGSDQLNDNTYYAKVIDPYTFDIYNTPYVSTTSSINDPVLSVSSYLGGGYAWRQGLFFLSTAVVQSTSTNGTLTANSVADLVPGTPVYFNEVERRSGTALMGGLVQGQLYYVKDVNVSLNTFTISNTRFGDTLPLLSDTGLINVVQWSQENVDRLYVTINGYRVPSSKLKINPINEISILSEIIPGDQVIITSMIPTASPDQETYINFVNNQGEAEVYRLVPNNTTWLTQPVYPLSDEIYVNDVRSLTNTVTQNSITPALSGNFYFVGLPADKNSIANITIYNQTKNIMLSGDSYVIQLVDLSPTVKVTSGSYISTGDVLVITILEGNTIYINGEQIRFGVANFETNTISNLIRGVNGTAQQTLIPAFVPVYGLLSINRLSEIYYNQTWNSNVYNPTEGDPLQISTTVPARFLNSTDE
jgi:hypothetical protein